jgi:hypothetical protein
MKKITPETYLILARMDVDAALKNASVLGYRPQSREIALAGMHKARLLAGRAFTRQQREASRAWLIANNFKIPGEPVRAAAR